MPDGKKQKIKKDGQLVIRINSEERDRFIELCEDLDTSAAREIRGFIRRFVEQHKSKDDTNDPPAPQ